METGNYTSDLLGTIQSHLAGLQGYDIMAMELIQNAEDAKATEVIFDVTDDALVIWNNSKFKYCGRLVDINCPFYQADRTRSCDYHSIIKVANGQKKLDPDNIGRFGIGFVSTYQIADHPMIESAGVRLILFPEKANWIRESIPVEEGTRFTLQWARDPNSQTRLALDLSPLAGSDIEKLIIDFQNTIRRSLLFLSCINKVELKRNGTLVFKCELDRGKDSELMVTFYPTKEVEFWYVFRVQLTNEKLKFVHDKYPKLEKLKRSTLVSVAIRTEPEPLKEGYLYAYLPTEQPTGLPLHINADFFPEADRKRIIFSGGQHQQAWNEELISVAAGIITDKLESLYARVGYAQLWEIISKASNITLISSNYPACFSNFWSYFQSAIRKQNMKIALMVDNQPERLTNILLPPVGLEANQIEVLKSLGAKLVHEELRRHWNVLRQLGVEKFQFKHLIGFLDASFLDVSEDIKQMSGEELDGFYLPLWKILDSLVPDETIKDNQILIQKFKSIPVILDWELYQTRIDCCYALPGFLRGDDVAKIFPRMWITHEFLKSTPKIYSLLNPLNLETVLCQIQDNLEDMQNANKPRLQALYRLLADLDELTENDEDIYTELRSMPIWMTGKGLVTADHALLPGNFNDPTGQADLIDSQLLDSKAREFVKSKIGIQSQTIETYVRTFLPKFFMTIRSVELSIASLYRLWNIQVPMRFFKIKNLFIEEIKKATFNLIKSLIFKKMPPQKIFSL